jgi:hypothetical protein
MASNVTLQNACLRALKFIGCRQFAPEPTGSQLESVQPTDLDDLLLAANGAMQECYAAAPDEIRQQYAGSTLFAPTNQTCTATQYSATISGLTGYQPYMNYCTIRIGGDTQDNMLVNATTLVRPYQGNTAPNIPVTIFSDCLTLPSTVDQVKEPVELPNQWPLIKANSYIDFLRWAGVPLVTDEAGQAYGFPFYYFYQKTVSRPRAYWCDTWYNPTTAQQVKMLRVAPLPDQTYPLAYRVAMNPPFYQGTDICEDFATGNYTDPGTLIPVSNAWVASIFMPYFLQRWTSHPAFKNESAKAEIMRQFKQAEAIVTAATVVKNPNPRIRYV